MGHLDNAECQREVVKNLDSALWVLTSANLSPSKHKAPSVNLPTRYAPKARDALETPASVPAFPHSLRVHNVLRRAGSAKALGSAMGSLSSVKEKDLSQAALYADNRSIWNAVLRKKCAAGSISNVLQILDTQMGFLALTLCFATGTRRAKAAFAQWPQKCATVRTGLLAPSTFVTR